jgi:hypothetical protein
MKKITLTFTLFLSAFCFAKSTKITVENPLDFDRIGEIVEVTIADLKNAKLDLFLDKPSLETPSIFR